MAESNSIIPIDTELESYEGDSAYGDSDEASATTSLKSAITKHYYQNGRRYNAYRAGSYWGPNDEQQCDLLDITHHIYSLAIDGRLFLAPIGDHPQKILDVGTGTGIWAMDIADHFPSAQVIGTDLSPIQPREVPPNLQFEIDDACSEWVYAKDSFDFIHVRGMYGSVSDWAFFYNQVYQHLKPGGWFEQVEFGVVPKSDDGSVAEDSVFAEWGRVSLAAGDAFGKSLRTVDEARPGIEAAGFVNVVEHRLKSPVGAWSSDPKFKEIGQYSRLMWQEGLEGWCMYLLTNYLHWHREEVLVYLARMRKMLNDKNVHCYVDLTFVYGQKPIADHTTADSSSYQSFETSTMSSVKTGDNGLAYNQSTNAQTENNKETGSATLQSREGDIGGVNPFGPISEPNNENVKTSEAIPAVTANANAGSENNAASNISDIANADLVTGGSIFGNGYSSVHTEPDAIGVQMPPLNGNSNGHNVHILEPQTLKDQHVDQSFLNQNLVEETNNDPANIKNDTSSFINNDGSVKPVSGLSVSNDAGQPIPVVTQIENNFTEPLSEKQNGLNREINPPTVDAASMDVKPTHDNHAGGGDVAGINHASLQETLTYASNNTTATNMTTTK